LDVAPFWSSATYPKHDKHVGLATKLRTCGTSQTFI
jgi:hypothetical protein